MAIDTYNTTGEPKVIKEVYIKKSRMLSMGKFNFSPSLEQTPKARSSKNSLSFSMNRCQLLVSKILKKTCYFQTTLIIRLFWIFLIFFSCSLEGFSQGQERGLEDQVFSKIKVGSMEPRVHGDSLYFKVLGKIPHTTSAASFLSRLQLLLVGSQDTLDLGPLTYERKGGIWNLEQEAVLPYQDWMEASSLLLVHQSKNSSGRLAPLYKVLAVGVVAPQRLVLLEDRMLGEHLSDVGKYVHPSSYQPTIAQEATYVLRFSAGSSVLSSELGNQDVWDKIRQFIQKNSSLKYVRITGLQSPEQAEGRSSQLGYQRAIEVEKKFLEITPQLDPALVRVDSRWNDWFDFRKQLASYSGISEERKEIYIEILQQAATFVEVGNQLRKLPDFQKVSTALYPNLRAVTIEIKAKPYLGLSQEQIQRLQQSLLPKAKNKLSKEEWAIAAAEAEVWEEKGFFYSKLAEYYPSPIPYNNLAVVRMRQAQLQTDAGSREILLEEALRLLDACTQLGGLPQAVFNQGQALVLLGDYWEGYKKISEVTVLAKGTELGRESELLRGALDIRRGDYKLATLRFETPITEAKDYFNKGLAFYLLGDYMQATLAFEESVLMSRELGYGYYGLALVAMQLGQKDIATLHLQKAIKNVSLQRKVVLDPHFKDLDLKQVMSGVE
jgi:tetratricopeptide (TPR) repeat protein